MTPTQHPSRSARLRLSVVIATGDFPTIERLVGCLAAQTIAGELELVVVCPARAAFEPPAGSTGVFGRWHMVEHPLVPLGEARAAGIRAAQSPVVVVAETHAFPDHAWAEHLVRAHAEGWDAVMSAVENENADHALSWSAYLVDYGRWSPTRNGSEIADPPSYHASFRRDPLLAFGSQLGVLLEPGSTLADELRAQGYRSWHEPLARISHLNVSQPRAWLHERFLGGRLLGASRRARWSRARTLVYLAGSPLVPAIRLWRSRDAFARARRTGRLPRWTGSATVLGCIAWGVGEAVGYIVGEGGSSARMAEYELHKQSYLSTGDRHAPAP